MTGARPILMNELDADILARVLRRQFRGGGGIEIHQTYDGVTITNRSRRGGDGGGMPALLHKVRVKLARDEAGEPLGDWGNATDQCSWVYDLYPDTGEMTEDALLVAAVANVGGRADIGRYRAAADGTYAVAVEEFSLEPDDPGRWRLIEIEDEVEDIAICNAAAPGAT